MKEYEFDVKSVDEFKEKIFDSFQATIETLQKQGLQSGTVQFDFMGANIKCHIELKQEH